MNLGCKLNTKKIVKLLRHLKELAFEKNLKNDFEIVKRERRMLNLDEVNTVGILYHFSDEETNKIINEFVSVLKSNHRKVTVIGHFNERTLPQYYIQTLDWNILTPKKVNWFNKPAASFVKSFCDQEFDLLIDLTMEDFQPIIYTGALSRAHFKTGRYTERNAKYYDLMINTEQVQSLPEFIQHFKHYISKVNR